MEVANENEVNLDDNFKTLCFVKSLNDLKEHTSRRKYVSWDELERIFPQDDSLQNFSQFSQDSGYASQEHSLTPGSVQVILINMSLNAEQFKHFVTLCKEKLLLYLLYSLEMGIKDNCFYFNNINDITTAVKGLDSNFLYYDDLCAKHCDVISKIINFEMNYSSSYHYEFAIHSVSQLCSTKQKDLITHLIRELSNSVEYAVSLTSMSRIKYIQTVLSRFNTLLYYTSKTIVKYKSVKSNVIEPSWMDGIQKVSDLTGQGPETYLIHVLIDKCLKQLGNS